MSKYEHIKDDWVREALEDYKRGSWVTTASLYGTDSTALYEMYPQFKNSSLLPSITNAKKDLLTVDNRAMAIRLYELGFLQAGDKVVVTLLVLYLKVKTTLLILT